jgi:hypothetical protein
MLTCGHLEEEDWLQAHAQPSLWQNDWNPLWSTCHIFFTSSSTATGAA